MADEREEISDGLLTDGRKILILTNLLGAGGLERTIVNLSGTWIAAGHDVTIATSAANNPQVYDLPAGAKLLTIGISGDSRGLFSGIKNNYVRLSRLSRLLKREKPNIVIGMGDNGIMLGLIRKRRTLAIGSERTHPPRTTSTRRWHIIRCFAYGRLDAVTVQTSVGRDWLLRHTSAREVAVIPNWIQLPLSRYKPELTVADYVRPGQRILLAAGRLVPVKAFDRLIAAFSRLAAKHPDWILAITGEGGERPALEQQIAELGLQGRVTLPGWAGNPADWYLAADVFALTSLSEGFPNVLIEALANGCPTVSVDCDTGPRDIIRHEKNGLLVPQDDPDALVAALDRLMSDDDLRKAMAARAPEVLEKFSRGIVMDKWEKLFATPRRRGLMDRLLRRTP